MTTIIKNLLSIIILIYSINVFGQSKQCITLFVENKSKKTCIIPVFSLERFYTITNVAILRDTLFVEMSSKEDTIPVRDEGTGYAMGKYRRYVLPKKNIETTLCLGEILGKNFFYVHINFDNYIYIYKKDYKKNIYQLRIDKKYIKKNW